MLYDNGIIDGDALNNALKALNNAPQAQEKPQEKTLIDKVREKRRRKKKLRKQRKAIAEKEKNVINELKEKFKAIESPFRLVDKTRCSYLRSHEISVTLYKDPVKMFQDKKSTIKNKITAELQELTGLKWSFGLTVDFFKDNKKIKETFYSNQYATLSADEIDSFFGETTSAIVQKIEKFTKEGSGWMIDKCNTLFLNIAKYEPLKGSSFIPLPEVLAHTKAIINVKKQDQACLRWAIRSALFPAKNNLNSPYSYPKQDNLNMEGIDFPTPISQINKLERQNNIALNVYGYERAVVPYHISGQPIKMPRINLLLLHDKPDNYHYCWIKHLSRMLFDQNKHKAKTYFCDHCLYGFSHEDLLINHKDDCYGINDRATKIQMPAPGEKIKFKNYHKQLQVPFVIYADFESIIKPYQTAAGDKSEIKSKHQACGFGYQIVRYDGALSNVRIYRGKDAVEQFLKSLHQEVVNINAIFAKPKPIHMSEKNERDFQSATQCWICQKEFNNEKIQKLEITVISWAYIEIQPTKPAIQNLL